MIRRLGCRRLCSATSSASVLTPYAFQEVAIKRLLMPGPRHRLPPAACRRCRPLPAAHRPLPTAHCPPPADRCAVGRRGLLLADEMGLGKTVSVIGAAAW